mgnify:FL=1
MTALPAPQPDGAFHYDPADWLPVAQAAGILGINEGALRRKAAERLADAGLALFGKLPSGRDGWSIHRSYDKRLLEQSGPVEAADLDGFGSKQQRLAWARWDCLQRFREAKQTRSGPVSRWLPGFIEQLKVDVAQPLAEKYGDKLKISRSALHDWDRKARTIADVDKLVDRRGGDTFSQGSPEFWKEFGRLYLTDSRRKVKACWRRARDWARSEGFDGCSYQSVLRQLDERFPPAVQLAYRNPKAYRDRVEPTGQLDPETFSVNQRWESDQRICDVRVIFPDGRIGRPILTAWLDWRTRRCVGHRVEAYGDSETISTSLHAALTNEANAGGPPEIVWFDRGADYLSVAGKSRKAPKVSAADLPQFRGVLAWLGIDLHLALPRGPRGKARIERWFQFKGVDLDAFLLGFCGNEPANRPESLAAKEKARKGLLTLDQYRREVAEWIASYNADADHDKADLADGHGRKLSPNGAYRAWITERRLYPRPEALKYLLMRWGKPLTVSKKGIRIEVDGQAFYYGAASTALIPYRNAPGRRGRKPRRVFAAYNPENSGHIYVWEANKSGDFYEPGKFICRAELNHAGGQYGTEANRRQMKQVARDRTRFNRAAKEYLENAPRQTMRPEDRLALVAAKQRQADARQAEGEDDHGPPPAIKPVSTPIDGELPAVARAELRQAAGGETAGAAKRPQANIVDAMNRLENRNGRNRAATRPRLKLADAFDRGRS